MNVRPLHALKRTAPALLAAWVFLFVFPGPATATELSPVTDAVGGPRRRREVEADDDAPEAGPGGPDLQDRSGPGSRRPQGQAGRQPDARGALLRRLQGPQQRLPQGPAPFLPEPRRCRTGKGPGRAAGREHHDPRHEERIISGWATSSTSSTGPTAASP